MRQPCRVTEFSPRNTNPMTTQPYQHDTTLKLGAVTRIIKSVTQKQ